MIWLQPKLLLRLFLINNITILLLMITISFLYDFCFQGMLTWTKRWIFKVITDCIIKEWTVELDFSTSTKCAETIAKCNLYRDVSQCGWPYVWMINPHWKYQTNKNGKIFNLRMIEDKLNVMIDNNITCYI